jgi:hypothetical protein
VICCSNSEAHHWLVAWQSYFSRELGFACPEHIDFADFLVDVCTDDASIYFRGNGPPPSSIEMAERFRRSKTYNDYIAPRFHEEYMQGLDPAKNAVNKAPFNRSGSNTPNPKISSSQPRMMGFAKFRAVHLTLARKRPHRVVCLLPVKSVQNRQQNSIHK